MRCRVARRGNFFLLADWRAVCRCSSIPNKPQQQPASLALASVTSHRNTTIAAETIPEPATASSENPFLGTTDTNSKARRCPCLAYFRSLRSSSGECICIRCFSDQLRTTVSWYPNSKCHVANCGSSHLHGYMRWIEHLHNHFLVSNKYRCDSPYCGKTFGRWGDLKRHAEGSHCSCPTKFPCSFPGCERGGDNGFMRKDKLKSHYKIVHQGLAVMPKKPRTIAPKP